MCIDVILNGASNLPNYDIYIIHNKTGNRRTAASMYDYRSYTGLPLLSDAPPQTLCARSQSWSTQPPHSTRSPSVHRDGFRTLLVYSSRHVPLFWHYYFTAFGIHFSSLFGLVARPVFLRVSDSYHPSLHHFRIDQLSSSINILGLPSLNSRAGPLISLQLLDVRHNIPLYLLFLAKYQ